MTRHVVQELVGGRVVTLSDTGWVERPAPRNEPEPDRQGSADDAR